VSEGTGREYDFQYDEMHQAGADHADVDRARAYDELMQRFRDYDAEVAGVAARLSIEPRHRVLDIGAGTGALAVGLAQLCERVTAVDVSPAMLEILREKAARAGVRNIETVNAGFLTFDARGRRFDRIVSNVVLHHLPDFWKLIALRRVGEMLADDGVFFLRDVIFSFEPSDYRTEMNAMLNGLAEHTGQALVEDGVLHFREEFSTFDWILDEIIAKSGLAIVDKAVLSPTMIEYLLALD
jgi:putative AdoMet-dependent methyltransferase